MNQSGRGAHWKVVALTCGPSTSCDALNRGVYFQKHDLYLKVDPGFLGRLLNPFLDPLSTR